MKTTINLRLIQTVVVWIFIAYGATAQSGALKGQVLDKTTKEPVPFASVIIEKAGKQIGGAAADIVGEFTIKPIPPGTYDVRATNVGYTTVLITNIVIFGDKITYQNLFLEPKTTTLSEVIVTSYKEPLIDKDYTTSSYSISSKKSGKFPGRDAGSTTTTTGGTFSTSEKVGDIGITGSRTDGDVTYIDGVKVVGSKNIPKSSIKNVSVITGGLSGDYGDVTGGVVSIKKKFAAPVVSEDIVTVESDEIYAEDMIETIPEKVLDETSKEKSSTADVKTVGAGILTAGELNDYSKWELWKDISENDLFTVRKEWNIYPRERVTVQVLNLNGKAVIDCEVLLIAGNKDSVWLARTDNTGKAELWVDLFESEKVKKEGISVRVKYKEKTYPLENVKAFGEGVNIIKIAADCEVPLIADVLFTVDATSSMSDEMEYLKAELNDIIVKVNMKYPQVKINLGSVFYRDYGDEYVTRKSDFSYDISKTVTFIKDQVAAGGGDYPEAVDEAFVTAIHDMKWSSNATARIMFLILDAPPHGTSIVMSSLQNSIKEAASKGIRIIPITASGINKSAEYLLRSIALATNGTYVFLTDHSNVGGSHIKPSTDEYDVTYLNDLIISLFYKFLFVVPCDKEAVDKDNKDKDTMYVYNPEIIDHVVIKNPHPKKEKKTPTEKDSVKTAVVPENPDLPTVGDSTKNTQIPPNNTFEFKYYPNPTSGMLNIELEGDMEELYLADITGKLLEKYKTNHQEKMQINIGNYPTGVYFIQYLYKDKWITGKVLLHH